MGRQGDEGHEQAGAEEDGVEAPRLGPSIGEQVISAPFTFTPRTA